MDAVVETDYGQFTVLQGDVHFDGDADRFFAGQINGWVGAGVVGALHVVLARRSGGSAVRIELWEDEPPQGGWEDVVEVSTTFHGDEAIEWETWAGVSVGAIAVPPATYRVRVSAHGRDDGRDGEFAEGIVDRYLMQLWPAAAAPDQIIRTSSADADYWNSTWGNRRR
jgi:hypothetical protein